jgi:hypothetical protein
MNRKHILSVAFAATIALYGIAGAQVAAPDQGAAPPGSNPNLGDGTGAGPAGSIGDPNGTGPGAAAPQPGPGDVDPTAPNRPAISSGDRRLLKSCLAMPASPATASAQCRDLRTRHPELFSAPPAR